MHVAIVDGSFLLHRVRFTSFITNWKVLSFMFIKSLITSLEAGENGGFDRIYVIFDKGICNYRSNIIPSYKANRKKDIEKDESVIAYEEARQFLNQELNNLGIVTLLSENIEGDDFGYYLSNIHEGGLLVSEDKDWFLIMRPEFKLYRPLSESLVSWDDLVKEYGDNPTEFYRIYKTLSGDKSDNIGGIPGIGHVRATMFAKNILNGKDLGDSKAAQSIRENRELYDKTYKVVGFDHVVGEQKILFDALIEGFTNNCRIISQSKWLSFCDKIDSETLATDEYYFRLKDNLITGS